MHDVVGALREPESAPGDLKSSFPVPLSDWRTDKDKTPGDPTDPIEQLRGGDRQALATLFDKHRDRLRRMVELRIDARLRARLDPSDVLQDA